MLAGHLRARRDADPAAGGAREARARGRQARAAVGCTRASTARRASPPGASGSGATRSRYGIPALVAAGGARAPGHSAADRDALDQGRSRRGDSSRVGYEQVQAAFGPGATGPLQIVAPAGSGRRGRAPSRSAIPGIAQVLPRAAPAGDLALIEAIPQAGSLDPGGRHDDRPAARRAARRARWSAARSPRTTTSRRRCRPRRRW